MTGEKISSGNFLAATASGFYAINDEGKNRLFDRQKYSRRNYDLKRKC